MALTKTPIELSSTPGIVDNSNNTAITINSSENVGIGIGLPASLLDVASTGEVTSTVRSTSTSGARQATLRLNVASTGGDDPAGRVQFTYGTGYTVAGSIEMTHTNPAMKFLTGTTEVMRISGSNVGIGTSSPTQELEIKAASIPTLKLNQAGTYGAEIALRGNDLDIAGSANAIVFYTGGNNDVSTTERMRILSTGGITFNGETAQGNALDAYEEGTWTPVIKALGTGGNAATATYASATYTKVGNLVNVSVYISNINLNTITVGSYIALTGLPFTATNYGDFTIAYKGGAYSTAGNIIGGYLQTGTTYAYLMRADGEEALQTSTDLTMTKAMINLTYQAS